MCDLAHTTRHWTVLLLPRIEQRALCWGANDRLSSTARIHHAFRRRGGLAARGARGARAGGNKNQTHWVSRRRDEAHAIRIEHLRWFPARNERAWLRGGKRF